MSNPDVADPTPRETDSCAVYIMTNRHRTVLYVGVTSSLRQRIAEHRAGVHPSAFTRRYNVDRLVYYETHCRDPGSAHLGGR